MSDVERRYTRRSAELRAEGGKSNTIGGYASIFNKMSSDLGGFVERVDARAFNKSRGDGFPDVQARYNHDSNMLLGTTASGTLRLSVDSEGLMYEVDVPQARADVLELVARGDVTKSSFAFRTMEDSWDVTENGYPLRTLEKVQLVDVAPVNVPAYPDSSAGLRSLAERFDADYDEVRQLAERNELVKFFKRTDGPKSVSVKQARMQLLARKHAPYQD